MKKKRKMEKQKKKEGTQKNFKNEFFSKIKSCQKKRRYRI